MQNIYQRLFYILIAVYGVVILTTFSQYGITTDEPLHVAYGENIGRWYESFFKDRTVFHESNLWIYGGLFDTLIYVLRDIFPLDVYDLRHLLCAGVGMLGVVGAYKIGTALGDYRTGVLAALFLVLTPRFYGHAFNNSKDIPFAVAYLWSLYYLIRCVGVFPLISQSLIWKTGLALGCALGVRASGAVLVGYMGLFFLARFVQLIRDGQGVDLRAVSLRVIGIGIVAYLCVFPFFPWLQIHPVSGLWDSFRAFASFPEVHYVFFEGQYLAGNALPWYYAVKWFLLTLPEFVLIGLAFGAIFFIWHFDRGWLRDVNTAQRGLLVFAALFPLVYGMFVSTPLLNAIRHMTFVAPPLVIASVIGVVTFCDRLSFVRARQGLSVLVGGAVLLVLVDMIVLHPNQYVYFNRLFGGGVAQASKHYETDYWNHAHKQGVRWVERHVGDGHDRKIVIGSLYKNVAHMIDTEKFEFTQVPEMADFYLGNTWFDHHRTIPGDVLHVVEASGAPLLYVIRPDDAFGDDPLFSESAFGKYRQAGSKRSQGNLEGALADYESTLVHLSGGYRAMWLDSSAVYSKMGNVLLQAGRLEEAQGAFEKIADQKLYTGAISHNTGIYYVRRKDYQQAKLWLEKAVDAAPQFFEAHVSLANVFMTLGYIDKGVQTLREVSTRHVTHLDRQIEVGRLLYEVGHFNDAALCFQRAIDAQYSNTQGHYYLGLTHAAIQDYLSAKKVFEKIVDMAPDHGESWQSLGAVNLYLKDYPAAISAYTQAIQGIPPKAELYSELGMAYLKNEQADLARDAFDQALAIDPNDETASEYLKLLPSALKK